MSFATPSRDPSLLVEARAFARLDAILRRADASGVVRVSVAPALAEAVSAHAIRRARAAGRSVICAGRAPIDDAARDLTAQVAGTSALDAHAAAEAIARDLAGAVAVVIDRTPTTWGAAVWDGLTEELSRDIAEGQPLLVLISCAQESSARNAGGASRAHASNGAPGEMLWIGDALAPEESALFWEAVADDANRALSGKLGGLAAMERFWSQARSGATPASALDEAALRLLRRLVLSERSWHPRDLVRLGTAAAREALLHAGAIEVSARGRAVMVVPGWEARSVAEASDEIAVAEVLFEGAAPLHGEVERDADAWALMRAAELFASAGDLARAEQSAARAIGACIGADARADLWSRWNRVLDRLPDEGAARRLRAAELALRVGDADRALQFARSAASSAANMFEATLLHGRAMAARGDLTTARVALDRAHGQAESAASKSRAAVELSEVHYTAGEMDRARAFSESALTDAAPSDMATRLKARNVLGKLLLAEARWAEAETHFATDAWEAACAGDHVSELRARLNRAVALVSFARYDEARAVLLSVLHDGEACGELRAVCFAVTNLAIVAHWKDDYADALAQTERSIGLARRIGDKILLAQLIRNLADVRLRLGLVPEAEQALAFGRKACGDFVFGTAASLFALLAARVNLARGRTHQASADLDAAIATAGAAVNGAQLGHCYRVAARVALEDGDLARAREAIEKARGTVTNSKQHAEAVLLQAMWNRANGDPFGEEAAEALDLARQANDKVISVEAHVLLHHAAVLSDDEGSARLHLDLAVGLRNSMAAGLPEDLKRRFLARRDFQDLGKLEVQFAREEPAAQRGPHTMRSGNEAASDAWDGADAQRARSPLITRPGVRAGASFPPPIQGGLRRLAGRDAAMMALLSAVQKVGPSDATVLIHGESGTGKELVADALHEASQRRSGPLVKVNCAALVETLLLSELFGHEKGAFTGAAARRRGRFEMAEGGTLFLDEIGDISPRTQVALLRVLQEKTFERVGGVTPIRANVRVVCATHRDLKALVARGEFREDLYFRLTGVVLEVPALRQRLGDLPVIADALLGRISAERGSAPKRLSAKALTALARHKWPGNVRELENALRAASLFAEGDTIDVGDFVSNVESLRDLAAEPAPMPRAQEASPAHDGAPGQRRSPLPPAGPAPRREISNAPAAETGFVEENEAQFEGGRRGTNPAELERETNLDGTDASRNARAGDALNPTEVAYVHIRAGTSLHDLKRNIERDCIQRALTESKGNITKAASLLGMKRPRLSQLVKQYGFGGVSEDSNEGHDDE